jgi:hypothetical protein
VKIVVQGSHMPQATTEHALVRFMRDRLNECERIAMAASSDRDRKAAEPEHWHWECTEDDQPVDVDLAIASGDECLQHNAGDHWVIGLRSIEEYPTRSVGPVCHIIMKVQDVSPQFARHVQTFDPARIMRDVTNKRRIVEDYRITAAAARREPDARLYAMRDTLASCVRALAAEWDQHPGYAEAVRHGLT